VQDVLHEALRLHHVGCGPDFAFGHRRGGNVAFLAERTAELGIGFTAVPALADGSGPYSSTRIRRLLQDGYPERAAEELGRPWFIRGTVQHGDKRGRLLGFPQPISRWAGILNPRGVYAVTVRLPRWQTRPGVANIGRRPTIDDGQESRLEVHLFDFEGDLYGQNSRWPCTLLRAEKRFDVVWMP
jgi:riboflavin kinase/FMN adenylyltransferase